MDNDGIPIWIGDDRHVANGRLQRFKSEWASVFFEPRDGGSEILHFETDRSAARGRFPIRCAVPDPERVRPDRPAPSLCCASKKSRLGKFFTKVIVECVRVDYF